MRSFGLVIGLALAASCGTTGVLSTTTPTPSRAISERPAVITHVIAGVPPRAILAPDGKWLAAMEPPPAGKTPYEPTVLLYDVSGKFVARVVIGGGMYGWLPDSSGLYAATSLPQHAPPLAIIENDGRVTTTQIQFSDTVLSSDGKWLVSEQQENCCMNIVTRELLVSSRDGKTTRSLATASSEDRPSVALIGIDSHDRVVYRDGDAIKRVALAGGTPETLASSGDLSRAAGIGTSPDRTVMLIRGYEPDRWYVLVNDKVPSWDDGPYKIAGTSPSAAAKGVLLPLWAGPHSVLVRDATSVGSYDFTSGTMTRLGALGRDDVILAYGPRRLLVVRGSSAIVLDTSASTEADTHVDVGNDLLSVTASVLPSGSFILGTVSATYRID